MFFGGYCSASLRSVQFWQTFALYQEPFLLSDVPIKGKENSFVALVNSDGWLRKFL